MARVPWRWLRKDLEGTQFSGDGWMVRGGKGARNRDFAHLAKHADMEVYKQSRVVGGGRKSSATRR